MTSCGHWAILGSCCTSEEYLARANSCHPHLQIVNAYDKDHVLKKVLNTMDIFIEIVTNPDGFAFTHSMVRIAGDSQLWSSGVCVGAENCHGGLWSWLLQELSAESLAGKKGAVEVLKL